MKKLALILLFFTAFSFAQNIKKIDSLKQVISAADSPEIKANAYLKIIEYNKDEKLTKKYVDLAIYYAVLSKKSELIFKSKMKNVQWIEKQKNLDLTIIELRKLANEFKKNKTISRDVYYEMARLFNDNSVGDSASYFTEKGLILSKELADQYNISLGYLKLGNYAFYEFDYEKSYKLYLQADSVCNKSDSLRVSSFHAKIFNYLGYAVRKPFGYDKALMYYLKSKNMYIQINDNNGLQEINIGLAQLYTNQGEYEKALPLINEALAYQKKINGVAYSYALIVRGFLYSKMGRLVDAEKDYQEYYDLAFSNNDLKLQSKAVGYMGDLYLKKKEYHKSAGYYKRALTMFESKFDNKKIDIYLSLIDLYKESNNKEELIKTYEEYFELKNIVDENNLNNQIFDLEAKYQSKEKEQQIILLTNQSELAKKQKYLYIGLLVLFAIVGSSLFYGYRNKIKTAKKLDELNTLKSRFFANISHEFRTPLTMIKSPVQSLLAEITDENQKNKLHLIEKNSDRMLDLVDQLLELSKLDNSKLQLILKEGNLYLFLSTLIESFAFQAKENKLVFTSKVANNPENHHFDKDVIEKIVTNLLSNSIKYSAENEKVNFISEIKNNQLRLVVSNSGSTIKKEELPKLFERFYQKDITKKGVGIGLALVKELVELYKGKIEANVDNEVLSFTVLLPLEKINENALIVNKEASKAINTIENINETEFPVLLIVDDNQDIRMVLKNLFKDKYQILEAENGEQALKLAQKEIPNCIISDVMMPKMDGFEFTKQIKNNELTSFIPVILLTAKSTDEAHLEGLKSTADAYLTKPFNNEIVKETVSQLITERKKLQQRYSQELVLRPVDIVINSVDEKFIEKLQVVLDQELSNAEFSSEDFASAVGMSRMQLHRKLKSLLGVSSTEFLRNERLKIAAELLKKGNGNISDVAYAVGFNDVSYFSKCFKEMYGFTPSEILDSSNSKKS